MGVEDTKGEVGRTSSVKRNSANVGMSLEAAAAGVVDVDARATIYVSRTWQAKSIQLHCVAPSVVHTASAALPGSQLFPATAK